MWNDPGKTLLLVGFMFTSLSTLSVALRLCVRRGASDYIMLVALILTWGNTVVNYYQTTFGKEFYLLVQAQKQERKDYSGTEIQAALSGTLVTWYIYRPLFILSLALVKLSILTFYHTLVPPSASFRSVRLFRWTVYFMMVFMILYTFSTIAAAVFQCAPVWDAFSVRMWIEQLPGHESDLSFKCYSPPPLWAFCAIINFVTDGIILLLPLPIVLSLQSMSRGKRVGVFCILSLGMLTLAAGAVRMWILVLWSKDVESQSKYGTDLLTWGQVEVNCGIIGACAPSLRAVFRRWRERRTKKTESVLRRERGTEEIGMDGTGIRLVHSGRSIGRDSEGRSMGRNSEGSLGDDYFPTRIGRDFFPTDSVIRDSDRNFGRVM